MRFNIVLCVYPPVLCPKTFTGSCISYGKIFWQPVASFTVYIHVNPNLYMEKWGLQGCTLFNPYSCLKTLIVGFR